ncbi:hypothetical protein Taro_051230 [Colocasia esculenta]|uniref:Uncharacterized protein n=1 Tax=Colocasia esculenta TaxID=4460 RepID=A0A843XG56_COLES|nr:hypothetical protein [Colocasia esculenta]
MRQRRRPGVAAFAEGVEEPCFHGQVCHLGVAPQTVMTTKLIMVGGALEVCRSWVVIKGLCDPFSSVGGCAWWWGCKLGLSRLAVAVAGESISEDGAICSAELLKCSSRSRGEARE